MSPAIIRLTIRASKRGRAPRRCQGRRSVTSRPPVTTLEPPLLEEAEHLVRDVVELLVGELGIHGQLEELRARGLGLLHLAHAMRMIAQGGLAVRRDAVVDAGPDAPFRQMLPQRVTLEDPNGKHVVDGLAGGAGDERSDRTLGEATPVSLRQRPPPLVVLFEGAQLDAEHDGLKLVHAQVSPDEGVLELRHVAVMAK